MAVLIITIDDRGAVVRVERRADANALEKLATAKSALDDAGGGIRDPSATPPNFIAFKTITEGIRNSNRLTDAQKQEALDLYHQTLPGDRFAVVREDRIISQGRDSPKAPPPLFIVFVDP